MTAQEKAAEERRKQIVAKAKEEYELEGSVEIDDDAHVSEPGNAGRRVEFDDRANIGR